MKLVTQVRFVLFHAYRQLREITKTLRTQGVRPALAYAGTLIRGIYAWHNPESSAKRQSISEFDKKWGTDTSGMISPRALGMSGENAIFSNYYKASRPRLFRLVMSRLDLAWERFVFVDYGSGKGLVTMLASEYPFKKIVGVELSEQLCALARSNDLKYTSPTRQCRAIEIVCADATKHELPADPAVVFLFEPFVEEKIFVNVLRNIEQSLARNPRELFLIYFGLDFRAAVEASKFFAAVREEESSMVFRSVSRPL